MENELQFHLQIQWFHADGTKLPWRGGEGGGVGGKMVDKMLVYKSSK